MVGMNANNLPNVATNCDEPLSCYWNPTIVGSHYMEAAGIEPAWVRWSYQDFSRPRYAACVT